MTIVDEKSEKSAPVMYVVVTGEYSDYRIVSVWSSKKAAQDECELLEGDMGSDFRVEEWLMDVSTLDGARREVEGYKGLLRFNNLTGEATAADVEITRNDFVGEWEETVFHYPGNGKYSPLVSAYSATEEGAVALALEKFAEVRGAGK
ncbi:hypothetical protein D3C85_1454650 [compost metagenome]